MSLHDVRNRHASIIWDILFCAELKALFGQNTNKEREEYIRQELGKHKNKDIVKVALRRVIRSNNISSYAISVGQELVEMSKKKDTSGIKKDTSGIMAAWDEACDIEFGIL